MINFKTLKPLWFRSPQLEPDETIAWSVAANRQQGGRAVGGQLTLTSSRLIFTANRMDAALAGDDWSVPREAVNDSTVSQITLAGGPFTGGLRRRLRVELPGGIHELFVVRDPAQASSRLTELLAS